MRSASPEFDEVVLTDTEEDNQEEFSEEIPLQAKLQKFPEQDELKKDDDDDDAVMFDDSDDEFSLPHVTWTCIDSSLPRETADGALTLVDDKGNGEPHLSAEQEISSQFVGTNSMTMLNAENADKSEDDRVDVSEVDTGISQGLIFNISSVCGLDAKTSMLVKSTKTTGDSPGHSASRLSRKRSRVSKDESEEQQQWKRRHQNIDDVVTVPGAVVETILPQDCMASDGANLLPTCDNLPSEPNSESTSLLQYTSSAEAADIRDGGGLPNMLSQDCDASFSQGKI